MSAREQQRGVGLIEILVAVVIISIGFLAAARMQVDSMRYSQSAYYRSQAYFMASEMVDRMRSNVTGVRDGRYDDMETSAAAADPDCGASACSPEDIARQDLHDWSRSLYASEEDGKPAQLPSLEGHEAGGTITRTAAGRYTVRLFWGEIIDGRPTTSDLEIDFVAEI